MSAIERILRITCLACGAFILLVISFLIVSFFYLSTRTPEQLLELFTKAWQ